MTKGQINEFKRKFSNLNYSEQLEVARLLVDAISVSEKDEKYNDENIKFVDILSLLIKVKEDTKQRERLTSLSNRFKNLSQEGQSRVIDSIVESVTQIEKENIEKVNKEMCEKEGHLFSKWKKNIAVTYKKAWIDHQLIPNYREEHPFYERTCSRCGLVEKEDTKPQELIDKEKVKAKQRRIKYLRKELKNLEEN